MARFDREANILKQLKHPTSSACSPPAGTRRPPFFAMEYVEGESLDKILARRGPSPGGRSSPWAGQLLARRSSTRIRGHHPPRPEAVETDDPQDGTVSSPTSASPGNDVTALTGRTAPSGTASYMSPENARAKEPDA